jgi:hypothetical protein
LRFIESERTGKLPGSHGIIQINSELPFGDTRCINAQLADTLVIREGHFAQDQDSVRVACLRSNFQPRLTTDQL